MVDSKLQCCGVESWTDWQNYNAYFAATTWKPDDGDDDRGKSGSGKSSSRNNDDASERGKLGGWVSSREIEEKGECWSCKIFN